MRARTAAGLTAFAAATSLAFMVPAHAAPPPRPAAATKPPPAPPPNIALTLEAPAPNARWKIRVENTGAVPLRLTADARLLSLDITPPGAKKPIHCALPADMRPTNDIDRALVVPPKRSWSETFDPRLYCFGKTESAALAAGSSVVAQLGFAHGALPKNAKPSVPFVVSGFEGVEPAVAPLKEIAASPTSIGGSPAPAVSSASASTSASPRGDDDRAFPPSLSLSVPAHVGAARATDLAIPVTIRNDGARPITVLAKPESIAFDVTGPQGPMRCSWPTRIGGTVRDAYTTLQPKGRATVSVLMSAICPDNIFDQGGLYIVRPRLDTRGAGGVSLTGTVFDGEVIGAGNTLLRLHHGKYPPKLQRPALD